MKKKWLIILVPLAVFFVYIAYRYVVHVPNERNILYLERFHWRIESPEAYHLPGSPGSVYGIQYLLHETTEEKMKEVGMQIPWDLLEESTLYVYELQQYGVVQEDINSSYNLQAYVWNHQNKPILALIKPKQTRIYADFYAVNEDHHYIWSDIIRLLDERGLMH